MAVHGPAVWWLPAAQRRQQPASTEVPPQVIDQLTWRNGDQLRRTHLPGMGGLCVCCEQPFPCLGRRVGEAAVRLAETGESLIGAVRHKEPRP